MNQVIARWSERLQKVNSALHEVPRCDRFSYHVACEYFTPCMDGSNVVWCHGRGLHRSNLMLLLSVYIHYVCDSFQMLPSAYLLSTMRIDRRLLEPYGLLLLTSLHSAKYCRGVPTTGQMFVNKRTYWNVLVVVLDGAGIFLFFFFFLKGGTVPGGRFLGVGGTFITIWDFQHSTHTHGGGGGGAGR